MERATELGTLCIQKQGVSLYGVRRGHKAMQAAASFAEVREIVGRLCDHWAIFQVRSI